MKAQGGIAEGGEGVEEKKVGGNSTKCEDVKGVQGKGEVSRREEVS